MLFYIDRLTWSSRRKALELRHRLAPGTSSAEVRVLDPLPRGGVSIALLASFKIRFQIEEADFIAGRLRMPDGQPVYVAARLRANEVAMLQAREMMSRSSFLTRLNRRWGRNTILLHMARFLWAPAAQWLLRLFTADALFRQSSGETATLIIEEPIVFLPGLCECVEPGLKVERYSSRQSGSVRLRLNPFLWLLRQHYRKLRWSLQSRGKNAIRDEAGDDRPALLLLHEDDLTPDRSYRTQPHWLEPEDAPPSFRTLVIEPESLQEREDRREGGIHCLPQQTWTLARGKREIKPLLGRLKKDRQKCLFRVLKADRWELPSLFPMVRLLETASDLASFCSETRVKAFMTCENYLTAADAMQLVADPLGILTFSYQYSNMSRVGPAMMTTANTMATFSPLFHARWAHDGISPGRFVDTGYLYDGAFKYLQVRADQHRRRLAAAGARFVLCYFDENAFQGKYELVTQGDLRNEIMMLLNRVLTDSSLGLIVKSQFQRNAPSRWSEIKTMRDAAEATGRYMELSHGSVRNIVFPAEAALAADVVMGHTVGATAPLEAALAGARAILLNPYGMKTENDALYAKADIVYPSLDAALEAIRDYREGKPERAGLGDWSSILPQFDPFRDGQAGRRLRSLLDEAVSNPC
jgi:hypothetical protein